MVTADISKLELRYDTFARSIKNDDLEPLADDSILKILRSAPSGESLLQTKEELISEIQDDYFHSTKCGIVDYILMDPKEQKRLRIETPPQERSLKYEEIQFPAV